MDFSVPKVMGILNVTPDSFYKDSRQDNEEKIRERVRTILLQGADIIDIGGCSTRPGFTAPEEEEEIERIDLGCRIVRELSAEMPISLDTYRASVASHAIEKWGVEIINDVSGGKDPGMWPLIASEKFVYVLTHNDTDFPTELEGNITAQVVSSLSFKVNELHRLGVNDVIIDPGFGFAKTTDENFRLLSQLEEIKKMGLPVLVGLSRKSMIYTTLGKSPEDSLTGTVALNMVALEKGADILRVHDVKEAKEIVKLHEKLTR